MLKLIYSLYFIIIISSCAKISPLEGGYKDTLSPILIYSNPKNHSINFKEKVFSFEFDEIIDASGLSQKLIISPYFNNTPELKFKKNNLLLTFDSSFKENTTYILNFADGVKDITEGNPAKNTKLVFSTGNKIDSSFISGFVLDPLKNKFVEGALVVLYNKKDSLGLFNKKPLYFSFSNKDGGFLIENIKSGEYKMYSFVDENQSFIAESKNEAFGYLPNNLKLDSFISNINISLFKENPQKLKLDRKRERGLVYELTYSKYIKKVNVYTKGFINYSLNDNNLLRFYKGKLKQDSVFVIVEAFDSLQEKTTDSLFVSFGKESKRVSKLSHQLKTNYRNDLDDTLLLNFSFSKPINNKLFSFSFYVDTVFYTGPYYSKSVWNKNKTKNKTKLYLNQKAVALFVDSLKNKAIADSLIYEKDSIYTFFKNYYKKLKKDRVFFVVPKGSVVSIEKDTLNKIEKNFLFRGKDFYGSVSGSISGLGTKVLVQLVSENFSRIYKNKKLNNNFYFNKVEPGKYYIKIIIDNNENNKWDYGSILKNIGSEEIIYYKEKIEVRPNWIIEDLIINL
ncbi:MAG: Ig-like domain-containing protein [Marinoscillum sp.]